VAASRLRSGRLIGGRFRLYRAPPSVRCGCARSIIFQNEHPDRGRQISIPVLAFDHAYNVAEPGLAQSCDAPERLVEFIFESDTRVPIPDPNRTLFNRRTRRSPRWLCHTRPQERLFCSVIAYQSNPETCQHRNDRRQRTLVARGSSKAACAARPHGAYPQRLSRKGDAADAGRNPCYPKSCQASPSTHKQKDRLMGGLSRSSADCQTS
jgi:hypothetical protein